MKQGIHPNWHADAQVTCSCGNKFTVGSTLSTLDVDICSKCHPFFTGEVRFVDRQGRVDKFMKKVQTAQATTPKSSKKAKKAGESADSQSYRDILRAQQVELKKAAKTAKAE
jgi:large subunit ribosomal protein L31